MTLLAGSEAVSARTSYQQQLDVWVLLNETTSQPLFFSGVSFSLSMSYLCWLQDMISDLTIVPLRSGLSLQLRFCFLCLATFRSSFRVSGEGRSLVCIESKAPCRFLKLWTSLWRNLDLREIKIIGQSWRHFEVYDEKKGIMKRLRGKRRVMTNAFYGQLGLLLKTKQKTKALLSIVPVFFCFCFLQNRTRNKTGRNY